MHREGEGIQGGRGHTGRARAHREGEGTQGGRGHTGRARAHREGSRYADMHADTT